MMVKNPRIKNPTIPDPMAKLYRKYGVGNYKKPLPTPIMFPCPKCHIGQLNYDKQLDCFKCYRCHAVWS